MALQVDELRRGVGAERAAVWLLAIVRLHVSLYVVGVTRREATERTRVQLLLAVLGSCSLSIWPFVQRRRSYVDTPVTYAGSIAFRAAQA